MLYYICIGTMLSVTTQFYIIRHTACQKITYDDGSMLTDSLGGDH